MREPGPMPETPTGLVATVNEKTGVVYLTWDDNADDDMDFGHYTVYRRADNPLTQYIRTTFINHFWDLTVKREFRYFYAVSAASADKTCESAKCEAVAVTIPLQVALALTEQA